MAQPTLTTYGGNLRDLGYAGEVVNMHANVIDSKTNEGTIAIDFGNAVARGTTDNTIKAPTVDGDKIIGISVRHVTMVADASGNVNYPRYSSVPHIRDGYTYVTAFENAVRGDGVISVTAQNGKLGSTTGGAAGAGRVAVPNATWETTTTAGNIGIVRINQ